MVRRLRKSYRRRWRRRGFRRRKSLRSKVASINRRLASEVKKNDNVIGITGANFTQLTSVGLSDWAYCYPVLDASMKQGTQLDDIIGEQIKMKYLYLGFHLQTANANAPTTLRIMVVQDRNYREYQKGVPSAMEMYTNLFGMVPNVTPGSYVAYSDVTLLPYNPLQPGRFRVIRDFKMCVAPGWKQDYYRKLIILQRHTNSRGKIYFGPAEDQTQPTQVAWTSPVGYGTGSNIDGWLYFDVQVAGSQPNPPGVTVQYGRLGPYRLQVPDAADSQTEWERYQTQQYPYPITVADDTALEGDPADKTITYTTSRNGIYVLILRQSSPAFGSSGTQIEPQFSLSIQSRFAYYDN